MLTPLRDYRSPRDWKRPWLDPPGFFPGNCSCHCQQPTAAYYYYGSREAPITTVVCSVCSGGRIAECWQLIVSGITNGGVPAGTNCTNANGTFILTMNSVFAPDFIADCKGGTVDFNYDACGAAFPAADCSSQIVRWKMGRNTFAPNDWKISLDGDSSTGPTITWLLSSGSFNCNGSNTFAIDAASVPTKCCASYPATLTVTPIAC